MIIIWIALFLWASYGLLVVYYWLSWRSIPLYFPSPNPPASGVSVIIPARNEETNVLSCLDSLCKQDFPSELLQIILVDDHSTDNTWNLVKQFHHPKREIYAVQLDEVNEPGFSAYKKRAILAGIAVAHHDLIITTDADCTHPTDWLKTIVAFYEEKKPAFIAAPVIYENDSSALQIFQALDFLVLQGITGASVYKKIHSMCNGANLGYEKAAFEQVNGFDGIDRIPSGDDMLLMHKIRKKFPQRVHYLKSRTALVTTQPMRTWKDFFNQRIRWASKARLYDDKGIFWALLLVYLFNLSFLLLLVAGFWWPVLWLGLLVLWIAKTLVEWPLVNSVATYFGRRSLLKYFFFFQPLHIAYTIIAGWLGQFKKYEWKGRVVR